MNRKTFGGQRSGNLGHRDVKQLSRDKTRFARLDPDTQSRYDDLDDGSAILVRRKPTISRGPTSKPSGPSTASVAKTGAKNAEIVYKCRAPGAGKKVEAKWLIRQLNQKIEIFKPLLWNQTSRGDFEFYVRDEDTASTIKINSRRIFHKESGFRVEFHTKKVPAPWMQLKRNEVEIIQHVVDKRYNAETRILDLSNFDADEDFTSRDMLMNLTKGNVMLTVVDRIDEKYGNIVGLSLSNNRLRHLDYASALVSIAKFVKELDLSHNQIATEKDLDKFAGMPAELVFFEGNPICETFSQKSAYISYIHKTFPRCSMLDGVAVQPLVTTPEININEVMPFRTGYCPNNEIAELIEKFVIAYFECYDGPDGQRNRKDLHHAYDSEASQFTLTISNLSGSQPMRYHSNECYTQYIQSSHNVLTQEYFSRNRSARLARGAMDIAVALSKLPTSHHMKETFIVDVYLETSELLGFTVQGLFQDGDLTNVVPTPSFFCRNFLVSPRPGGAVAVISDQLFISSASEDRLTRYKKLLDQARTNGSAQEQVSAVQVGVNGLGFDEAPAEDLRQRMIQEFAVFSGMNSTYAEKCLADFNWNFELACQKFPEIRAIVPAEAFVN